MSWPRRRAPKQSFAPACSSLAPRVLGFEIVLNVCVFKTLTRGRVDNISTMSVGRRARVPAVGYAFQLGIKVARRAVDGALITGLLAAKGASGIGLTETFIGDGSLAVVGGIGLAINPVALGVGHLAGEVLV